MEVGFPPAWYSEHFINLEIFHFHDLFQAV